MNMDHIIGNIWNCYCFSELAFILSTRQRKCAVKYIIYKYNVYIYKYIYCENWQAFSEPYQSFRFLARIKRLTVALTGTSTTHSPVGWPCGPRSSRVSIFLVAIGSLHWFFKVLFLVCNLEDHHLLYGCGPPLGCYFLSMESPAWPQQSNNILLLMAKWQMQSPTK